MHKVHFGYTFVAPLRSDENDVKAILRDLQTRPSELPFEDVPSVHFATVTVIPAQKWGDEDLPACLMIATSFSGPAKQHVAELVRHMGAPLRALLAHCDGFPREATDRQLAQYIKDHRNPDTFYSGMHDLSRDDVLKQRALRLAIQEFLDKHRRTLPERPSQVREAIQEFVAGEADHEWALEPWKPTQKYDDGWWERHWRSMAVLFVLIAFGVTLLGCGVGYVCTGNRWLGAGFAACLLAIFGSALALLGLIVGVRHAEQHQDYVAKRPEDAHVRELAATQTHLGINEMTIAGPIKNGAARPIVMRLLLWVVARAAEGIPYIKSQKDGIHIPTVAAARWISLDRGRRLCFLSNFTNAAEPYVRDFVDTRAGAFRINISFGFGGGYPITEWIARRGANENPNAFIWVVAQNQYPTEFWFCPYRDMTIDNIVINRDLRAGLPGPMNDCEAQKWLLLL